MRLEALMTRLHPFAERDLQVECLMQGVAEEGMRQAHDAQQWESFGKDTSPHRSLEKKHLPSLRFFQLTADSDLVPFFNEASGQPQIEVTFEIDSNGILNVAAEDKGTGKSEKITITNDQGRLNEEQIQKMIPEGEEFADEDKKVKERVDARNAFDGYIHSMRSSAEGSGNNKGLSEKISSDEKETILDALKDARSWLDSNPEADVEEIKEKQKEVEGICAPIVSKYYGGGGGGGAGVGDDEEDFHDE
ncbi:Luminal-binding protein 8 (BiP 8) (78 kDa glucose-regulated protein homolog 8) (GRP-78-8) (Fragment) [Durusdinium trenchii]|uniref:Luminal-binding protein 8 (BiP 8) (78 kDa glucose-regulated protein homolog 8) (GRP-78-8) n=1 Tax=Durusdinium trenchii TaxID=1381693 RepID=A0ABP0KI22_9DINO